MSQTASDYLVQRLHDWGIRRVFGYPGDGIHGVMGALNRAGSIKPSISSKKGAPVTSRACRWTWPTPSRSRSTIPTENRQGRTRHVRFNNLDDPEKIPAGVDYASVIASDVPVVVQHTRLDSRQAENALLTTIAFGAD